MIPVWVTLSVLGAARNALGMEQCEGDACAGLVESSGESSTLQEATFILAAVACAGIVFDLLQRYIFAKDEPSLPNKRADVEQKEEQVFPSTSRNSSEEPVPAPVEEQHVTAQFASSTSSEPDKEKKSDGETVVNQPTESVHSTAPPVKPEDTEQLKDFVANLLDTMRTPVDLHSEKQELPSKFQEQLQGLALLEDPCKALSAKFDECSASMVSEANRNETEDEESQQEAEQPSTDSSFREQQVDLQKRSTILRDHWTAIRRLFYCVDVHLRNATAFQQYFYETDQLQSQLAEYTKHANHQVQEPAPVIDTSEALAKLLADTKATQSTIRLWEAHVNQLSDQSRSIVPLHMRTNPVSEPEPINMLCAYTTPEAKLGDFDRLMLVNNEDKENWRVETADGVETVVPAMTCLIPPPNKDAISAAAKLRRAMQESYQATQAAYKHLLSACTKDVFAQLLKDKLAQLEVIHPDHKKELLDDMAVIDGIINSCFTKEDNYEELCDMSSQIIHLIKTAEDEGEEDEVLLAEVRDMIANLAALLKQYKKLAKNGDNFRTLHHHTSHDDLCNDEEWDTLDDVDQATAVESSVDVSVARERVHQGEATSYTSSSGEVRQKFSIKSVIDPETQEEISMDEAVKRGVVDPNKGLYCDDRRGVNMPIAEAMQKGFILVESTQTKKTREMVQAVGVVTVTFTRETRPYTIRRVLDPRNDMEITVDEARELDIFSADRGVWRNPDTGEETSIENAIDCGGLIVDYDAEASVGELDVTTKTFAVYGVMDRKQGKRLPFYEASQRGLIDKEAGKYMDNLTGKAMSVVDALKLGYLKARIVTDPDSMDLGQLSRQLSKQLSVSSDSINSDNSEK